MLAPQQIDSGRRDTPTEMYVKGVHGAPAEEPEPPAGDRDTPTRAYELPAGRAPLLATMKSPAGLAQPEEAEVKTTNLDGGAPNSVPGAQSAPRFGAPPGPGALDAPAGALLTMPLGKQTVPLGNMMRGLSPSQLPPSQTPMPAPSALPATSKPGWQVALDRALIGVGRTAENLVRRFRSAPPNTQIIAMIVAGTVLVLLVGLVVFLATR
jgi:hypothetical protein